jgi:hypothetical protein
LARWWYDPLTAPDDERDLIWDDLYRRIVDLLSAYGKEEPTGDGDFWVVDDNYGWPRQTINVFTLKMLDLGVISGLRVLLDNFPDWEIIIALDVPGTEGVWPPMGVTIRKHEIIDGLQREYLPEPHRSFAIPGSRVGTGYD